MNGKKESINTIWSSLELGSNSQFETSWEDVVDWFQQVDCYPKLIWKGREIQLFISVLESVNHSQHSPLLPFEHSMILSLSGMDFQVH